MTTSSEKRRQPIRDAMKLLEEASWDVDHEAMGRATTLSTRDRASDRDRASSDRDRAPTRDIAHPAVIVVGG